MLKPGDTAVIKTTDEVVFILSVEPQTHPTWLGLSGTEAVVRRAVQTAEKGVYYAVERFQLDELESPEDRHRRSAKEYANFKRIAKEESTDVLESLTQGEQLIN